MLDVGGLMETELHTITKTKFKNTMIYPVSFIILALAIFIEWKIYDWRQFVNVSKGEAVGAFIGEMIGMGIFAGFFACVLIIFKHKFEVSKKIFAFNSFTLLALAIGYLLSASIHIGYREMTGFYFGGEYLRDSQVESFKKGYAKGVIESLKQEFEQIEEVDSTFERHGKIIMIGCVYQCVLKGKTYLVANCSMSHGKNFVYLITLIEPYGHGKQINDRINALINPYLNVGRFPPSLTLDKVFSVGPEWHLISETPTELYYSETNVLDLRYPLLMIKRLST